ncbi:unnamed protein product [Paramecium primaurelia]|uniref:Anaphase-promoting complex subunit 4-like WD40 domain-containing protein n=1 Tax=Paramecium primaurelia TaxID=5886 RepID=A0A8S1LK77_PARPR|nr:unnamed protein product [Paramecium primaurelia]
MQIRVICYNTNSYKCLIFNLILCKLIRKIELKKLPCLIQIIDKNKLLVGISNGDIQIFDISTVKLINNLVGHAYQVIQIQSFADQYLITLCQNKEARIWNTRNLQFIFKINQNIAVKQIYFSQDGQKVILVAYDGSVKIYQTQTGEIINQINYNLQQVQFIKFFQQIDKCLIAYQNKQERYVLLWDLKDYTYKQILQGFKKRIKDAYCNSNNFDLAVAILNSSKMIIYNILTEEIKAEIEGLNDSKINVQFTKNNHLIINDQQNILVYTDKGKFKQQLNTFIEKKAYYIKVLANQNHINNRKKLLNNDQIITEDEQKNYSQIWLETPSYFAALI